MTAVGVVDPLELAEWLVVDAVECQRHAARMSRLTREAFIAGGDDEAAKASWQVVDAELYAEARRAVERAVEVAALSESPP